MCGYLYKDRSVIEALRPEGRIEHIDPVAELIYGESLAAAGRLKEAHTIYSEALNNEGKLTKKEILTNASLHYSLAEIWRLQAAQYDPRQDIDKLWECTNFATDELAIAVDDLSTVPILDKPDAYTPHGILAQNALTYLAARTRGLLLILQAQSLNGMPDYYDFCAHALQYFGLADSALGAGTYPEAPIPTSLIPQRRRERRSVDVDLQELLATTERIVNAHLPSDPLVWEPQIKREYLLRAGPRASHTIGYALNARGF